MPQRSIQTDHDKQQAEIYLHNLKPPFLLSVTMGKHRTWRQNKLQRKWCQEISEQIGDQTPEEVRGYCKAWFGIPIRMEDAAFAEVYDQLIKPMGYEDKLKLMMAPIDLPVTRDMTTKQKARYLDAMYVHFTGLGVVLTDPEDQERHVA